MILDDLTAATRKRVAKEKEQYSIFDLQERVAKLPIKRDFPFEKMLREPGIHFICEIKRASPSKGDIKTKINVATLANDYEQAGADAISVLTEPEYFKGTLADLKTTVNQVDLPVLRKDFTIDPYMIYQAKLTGAIVILLIVATLTDEQLQTYFDLANQLGLSAIIEVHNADEIKRALKVNARIIGVNNRNLKNFTVAMDTSRNLRSLVPDGVLFISESGIKNHSDVAKLERIGVNGVLVGETMMLANDKQRQLADLKNGAADD
ncbi:indole-3-glycerol phosphate synthase [Fructilactobacillus lindneri]|uniref:Indole-3-glycerol phosphate synthase n=2 Tax=Fructilactobacillus lindneri TaxID=53444 RepID=A0A0R2JTS1_9LACO|nr:indole-3-glycerol phosphate synthase TrpC [Fructilactobacillus lindneri]ANZ57477.1 indole-3-glycerol phosphate synthase [Fructilactobacillus lindneri]ANZ58745.1 indole-3-glycerol phosphate synthase [Fructilactobacillus lindneri]KRN80462.1 hypothetical protein IV52_GL000036 [Fructilactobacillus lindneri DSM 20690 = JCM 11027]POG97825.1 indole-3-glycerol phosphate synthase [Fructilactobacillus lindneri]POG99158.1 indole-3-glycerol phosphate synthase [Fructilactobacillus lindneri]